ncbi:hypothetical protein K7X08_001184 [Anisodus acutangulus]|uniref:Uncharacterized protein n=1 Tax=Anisodus acutangulus TaxID=402998 RepID=A0A9Q1RMT1_9SOLA|nr:hypothetical protein K7X08_001184 [Anisodus acutangulus]
MCKPKKFQPPPRKNKGRRHPPKQGWKAKPRANRAKEKEIDQALVQVQVQENAEACTTVEVTAPVHDLSNANATQAGNCPISIVDKGKGKMDNIFENQQSEALHNDIELIEQMLRQNASKALRIHPETALQRVLNLS